TIVALQEANQLGASEQIRAGQTLRLPPVEKTSTKPPAPPTTAPTVVDIASVNETPARRVDPSTDTIAERVPAWVLTEPGQETQGEKPAMARGGIFPCAAPDPGFAHYAKWVQVAPMAHVL